MIVSTGADITNGVEKVIDFAGFFLSLGDMKQNDLLIAVSNRDPEFIHYFETVAGRIETALEFFRVYANWAIRQIQKEYEGVWDQVKDACSRSEKYRILKIRCIGTTLLWDELEKVLSFRRD